METPSGHNPAADELLTIRCQLGERAAFDALIARWADPLRRYVHRVAGDRAEADDLVQDIWLRVLRGLTGLRDPARFRSWLFGIAHRALVDRLRERYADRTDDRIDTDKLGIDDPIPRRDEVRRLVETGMAALPVVEREAVTLFYLQEFRLDEIAAALSVPVGTIKSRLHRARTSMRQSLTNTAEPENPPPTGDGP